MVTTQPWAFVRHRLLKKSRCLLPKYFPYIFQQRHPPSLECLQMLSITQYIFCPLPFRNPPDIFCRFLAFLRSLSLMLSSNGTRKSSTNSRWFSLYFSSLFSSVFSSFFAYLCFVPLFSCLPSLSTSLYSFLYFSTLGVCNGVQREHYKN